MPTISFFHGRKELDEDLNEWGFNGPTIEISSLSFTYDTLRIHSTVIGEDELGLIVKEGCVQLDGAYYGDFYLSDEKIKEGRFVTLEDTQFLGVYRDHIREKPEPKTKEQENTDPIPALLERLTSYAGLITTSIAKIEPDCLDSVKTVNALHHIQEAVKVLDYNLQEIQEEILVLGAFNLLRSAAIEEQLPAEKAAIVFEKALKRLKESN